MQRSFLDQWLDRYSASEINLGESGMAPPKMEELIDASTRAEFARLSLGYGDSRGLESLRHEVAQLHPGCSTDQVLITHGVTEALLVYFMATQAPHSNVVVVTPTFHPLYDIPHKLGHEVRRVPSTFSERWALPRRGITSAIDRQTSALVVCTPSNPTGQTLTHEDWSFLIELAEKHDCDILADEQYRFLPHAREQTAITSGTERSDRVVALSSVGKCFGAVDLRIGWLVGSMERVIACHAAKSFTTHGTFKGSDLLAQSILSKRLSLTPKYTVTLRGNTDRLAAVIDEHAHLLSWIRPQAGSIAFVRVSPDLGTSVDFARRLVEDTGVMVLPGEGLKCPGFVRIGLGVSESRFAEAMERLGDHLSKRMRPRNAPVTQPVRAH